MLMAGRVDALLRPLRQPRARNVLGTLLVFVLVCVVVRLWPRPPLSSDVSSSRAVYSADGRLLRLTLSTDQKYRLWVALEQISPTLVDAVLLHEDRWFRWHPGANPWSLGRGAWRTYLGGQRQGGSTLTMQLARLRYRLNTRTPSGKLEQALRALQLELTYSKHDILEAYLNLVPYGNNVEGVGAASLIYLGKPPGRLDLPDALTLAVVPQSPARRAPERGAPALKEARRRLFQDWVGTHHDAAADADLLDLPIRLRRIENLPFRAPHLSDLLLAQRRVDTQIRSSLDLDLQRTLERQLRHYVARERRLGIENATAMLVDYRTMQVKALVGSADFFDGAIQGQVNGALGKRSPGSTLKPFLYGLAMDQGLLHPMTVLKDAPTSFGPFSPENFDGGFLGPVTAQEALIRSRNVPAVAVAARLANPTLYQFLQSAGVTGLRPEGWYGLGLVLGGVEVTMEELATLYGALANRGVLRPLRYRVADPDAPGVRVLSEEASFMTLEMLKANPRPDQAFAAQSRALPVYWKTGTSWGFRDAWTAGIFGPYVLVVWIGNFDGGGNPAFVGIQAAAPLFFQIVDAVRAQQPGLHEPAFRFPSNLARVEVCAASGDLPNAQCPVRTKTWFIPGRTPIRVSDIHRVVAIDKRTGLRACAPYDGRDIRTEVFELWPSDMLRVFAQAGLPRRLPPPYEPQCKGRIEAQAGNPPRILSPLRATSYTLRLGGARDDKIALQAAVEGDVREVFWFVDGDFVARAAPGATQFWRPERTGTFVIRVVDDQGRAESRDLKIGAVR